MYPIGLLITCCLLFLCPATFVMAGSEDVSAENVTAEELETQILNEYRISIKRMIAEEATCEPDDYKLFLREFTEEAQFQGLSKRGSEILSLYVTKENWNMGPLVPSNWGGDVIENSPTSMDVGHLSHREAIRYIINELDPYNQPIASLVLNIQVEFGILFQWNTVSGAINFSKRKNFYRFLKSFYSIASSKKLGRFIEPILGVVVVAENWNGGHMHPANWGADIKERSGFRIEVGDESEEALVEEIVLLQSLPENNITSYDMRGRRRLHVESTLGQ